MLERKSRTRAAILASAGRLLRIRGIQNSSVSDVMAGAKLTVGGFYAHFRSKDHLFDAVLDQAARERAAELAAAGPDANRRLRTMLRFYLTSEHRDRVGAGCPLPSAVPDVSRGSAKLRRALVRVVEKLLEGAGASEPSSPERQLALTALALAYGGLSLARAVRGTRLSDEILAACAALGERIWIEPAHDAQEEPLVQERVG